MTKNFIKIVSLNLRKKIWKNYVQFVWSLLHMRISTRNRNYCILYEKIHQVMDKRPRCVRSMKNGGSKISWHCPINKEHTFGIKNFLFFFNFLVICWFLFVYLTLIFHRRKKKCSREGGGGNSSSSEGEGEECHALYRQAHQPSHNYFNYFFTFLLAASNKLHHF